MLFFTIFSILVLFAACICARGVFVISSRLWLSMLVVLFSITVPLSIYIYTPDIIRSFGHIYCGFILYFTLCCISVFISHKLKPKLNYKKLLTYSMPLVITLLIIGFINAMNPILNEIFIPSKSSAKICFISDIHVGSIGTSTILNRVSTIINNVNPDIVILGGDTLDLNAEKKYKKEFIKTFLQITKKFRTIAVIGNHETYSGLHKNIKLLQDAGIEVLLDQTIIFQDYLLIGRLDRTVTSRKNISDFNSRHTTNTIIIDHQPSDLSSIAQSNAFLYLAGHTHGGQIFPFNFIVNLMYPKTGVLQKIMNSYIYISKGAGVWGPPFRIGNRPEVVVINIVGYNAF